MKKIVLIICICLALTGCYRKYLVNPSVSYQQQDRDLMECNYEASKAYPPNYGRSFDPIGHAFATNELIEMCMRLRGYKIEYK